MKVGVIGIGEMGQKHVRVYHELGAEIVGIADLNEERVTKIASQYKARAFRNETYISVVKQAILQGDNHG